MHLTIKNQQHCSFKILGTDFYYYKTLTCYVYNLSSLSSPVHHNHIPILICGDVRRCWSWAADDADSSVFDSERKTTEEL